MAMCVEDRISSFPDHILCHILSFLPIEEAVRTSIISTKWRYLFASISTIKFDGHLMRGLTDRNVDSFKNFVDRLLKFPDQEIDLDLDNLGDILPALLFTCHSLVTLKLVAVGSEITVPSDVCLGNLKTLQLRNASFVVVEGYTLTNMKSLEKARLNICENDSIDCETSATHLIQGIRNVRSLSLTTDEAIFRTSQLPIFHNLIEFEYGGHGFNGIETWLVEFLHCAPNLETLNLNFPVEAGTRWKALPIEVPSCLSFHLKEIEISCFVTHMIEMVSYFLDNAMVLENLIIRTKGLSVTQTRKVSNQLLQLLKSSKKCLIVIL
ncbi:hypothetical protein V6Z11_A02G010400 [Gossypium hirsutum]